MKDYIFQYASCMVIKKIVWKGICVHFYNNLVIVSKRKLTFDLNGFLNENFILLQPRK